MTSQSPRKLKRFSLAQASMAAIGMSVVMSYGVHITFSDVCLRAKSVGQSSEDFLYSIRYLRYQGDLLPPNVKRLDAFVGTVFVYDADLDQRAKIVSVTADLKKEETSAAFVKLTNDQVYLDQLDQHKNGDCFVADIAKIKPGIFKSQAIQSDIKYRFSCPIKTAEGSLFGYVSYGYTKGITDLGAKIQEARSSALTRVLNQ